MLSSHSRLLLVHKQPAVRVGACACLRACPRACACLSACVCACVRVCLRACLRAHVRVRACVRAHVRVRAYVPVCVPACRTDQKKTVTETDGPGPVIRLWRCPVSGRAGGAPGACAEGPSQHAFVIPLTAAQDVGTAPVALRPGSDPAPCSGPEHAGARSVVFAGGTRAPGPCVARGRAQTRCVCPCRAPAAVGDQPARLLRLADGGHQPGRRGGPARASSAGHPQSDR